MNSWLRHLKAWLPYLGIAAVAGAVLGAVLFFVSPMAPPPIVTKGASAPSLPRALGPSASSICGPLAVPRPPPPVDSPFGVHLYATSPLGVVHPLRAMQIAEQLPPPVFGAQAGDVPAPGEPARPAAATPPLAAGTPSALLLLNETAQEDVESVSSILQEFRRAFGAMPVGEQNDEIVRRLRGENPKGIAVLPETHPAINAAGELLDRWGTPYRFHPESAWMTTVRSAGPDRRMWTSDDVLSIEESLRGADAAVAGINP
jgi:hypothetical protein